MSEGAMLRLGARQHGLVTTAQLASLGFGEDSRRRLVGRGLLYRVQRGVSAVAGTRDTFEVRVMAAVLAAGEGALASHRCAAALYGLRRIRCDVPEVTVTGRVAPRVPGVRWHRRETWRPPTGRGSA